MEFNSVGVIGGGAWGTALAQTLTRAGRRVVLWAREPDTVADVNTRRVNRSYLPGVALADALTATCDLAEAAAHDAILLVTPAQHVRAVARELAPCLAPGTPVVSCAKGIEVATGLLMDSVIEATLPQARRACLSGPSFANDVVRGLPAAVTLASQHEGLGRALARQLGYQNFRIYWTSDVAGVEIGGAVKNVLAIAAGIVEGRGLGASAHASMVTRGFAEMRRLGEAMGARPATMAGLSGLGDLVLTCSSPQSRNMSLGRALGQGKPLAEILAGRNSVTEGVHTAAAVMRLAASRGIEMPISEAVHAILDGRTSIDAAIAELMSRPFKAED